MARVKWRSDVVVIVFSWMVEPDRRDDWQIIREVIDAAVEYVSVYLQVTAQRYELLNQSMRFMQPVCLELRLGKPLFTDFLYFDQLNDG
jgi:hypothetical protein